MSDEEFDIISKDPMKVTFISSKDQFKVRESYQTIFNITNTMMGTALLVIPCNFYNGGILSSTFTALEMALVCYWTCNLVSIHIRNDEFDYPVAIKRLLGKKWEFIFNIVSFILLLCVSVINFNLISNVLYSIVISISGNANNFPGFKDICFTSFSMQYTGMILFIIFLISSNFSLSKILSINDKGIYMIFCFTIFIIYLGIDALIRTDIKIVVKEKPGKINKGLDIVLFDTDVSNLLGIFSLAYMVHNVIGGMMKNTKNPENNSRDIFISYIVAFFKYTLLGIFGSFAVAALYNSNYDIDNPPVNIMELLSRQNPEKPYLNKFQRVLSIIALIMVFIQILTVLPIFNFYNRRQFFSIILGSDKEEKSKKKIMIFNIGFYLFCLGCEMLVIDPSIIISYTGSIFGLLLVYVIPVLCHLKCLYFNNNDKKVSIEKLNNISQSSNSNSDIKKKDNIINFNNNSNISIKNSNENKIASDLSDKEENEFSLGIYEKTDDQIDKESDFDNLNYCREDGNHNNLNLNKKSAIVVYTLLILHGVFILVFTMYSNIIK